jgi:LTXXQ motif family protein
MRKRGTWLLAACTALAIAGTPALAQQSGQGGGMMGKGGPDQGGGMMGKGGPGHGGGMMGGGMGKGKDQCPKMGGMMRGGMMGKGMMGKGMMHSRPMMEARLAYIKADLDITDAQTDAWNAYADAVRSGHSAMESAREDMMKASESGNAVERMDARIEVAQAKLDNLKALKPATETLYDALTDDQKKKADGLLNPVCGRM